MSQFAQSPTRITLFDTENLFLSIVVTRLWVQSLHSFAMFLRLLTKKEKCVQVDEAWPSWRLSLVFKRWLCHCWITLFQREETENLCNALQCIVIPVTPCYHPPPDLLHQSLFLLPLTPATIISHFHPFCITLFHLPLSLSSTLHQLFGILHFASIAYSHSPLNWTRLIRHNRSDLSIQEIFSYGFACFVKILRNKSAVQLIKTKMV